MKPNDNPSTTAAKPEDVTSNKHISQSSHINDTTSTERANQSSATKNTTTTEQAIQPSSTPIEDKLSNMFKALSIERGTTWDEMVELATYYVNLADDEEVSEGKIMAHLASMQLNGSITPVPSVTPTTVEKTSSETPDCDLKDPTFPVPGCAECEELWCDIYEVKEIGEGEWWKHATDDIGVEVDRHMVRHLLLAKKWEDSVMDDGVRMQ